MSGHNLVTQRFTKQGIDMTYAELITSSINTCKLRYPDPDPMTYQLVSPQPRTDQLSENTRAYEPGYMATTQIPEESH